MLTTHTNFHCSQSITVEEVHKHLDTEQLNSEHYGDSYVPLSDFTCWGITMLMMTTSYISSQHTVCKFTGRAAMSARYYVERTSTKETVRL